MPKTEAVTNSSGDSDHVFYRSAEFHTDNVVVCVKTKARIAQGLLHGLCKFGVARRDGNRRRVAASDFLGKGGTAQDADAWMELRGNDLRDDFRHSQMGLIFNPFGRADEQHLF